VQWLWEAPIPIVDGAAFSFSEVADLLASCATWKMMPDHLSNSFNVNECAPRI
jgi:hypothetical protein